MEQIITKSREDAIRTTHVDDVSGSAERALCLSMHGLIKAVEARWPPSDCSWVGHASLATCVCRMTGSFWFSQDFLNLGVASPTSQYTSQSWGNWDGWTPYLWSAWAALLSILLSSLDQQNNQGMYLSRLWQRLSAASRNKGDSGPDWQAGTFHHVSALSAMLDGSLQTQLNSLLLDLALLQAVTIFLNLYSGIWCTGQNKFHS